MKAMGSTSSIGRLSLTEENDEDEASRLTMSTIRPREEDIERRKMEVKERVELQLSRAEEETKRLTQIWQELEELGDPGRKEIATIRKKVDITNREVKTPGQSCQKKEKEYKDALEAFKEKNKEKAQPVTTLMEFL